MARCLLALLWLPCSLSLRLTEESSGWVDVPNGTEVEPHGRHIQLLYWDSPHGLTDRIRKYLHPLVLLGHYYNATVHLHGGAQGAQSWLTRDHTLEIAETWGRYFDLDAHGGFHKVENFRGCRELKPGFAFGELLDFFQRGERCVNILAQLPLGDTMPREMRGFDLQVSQEIRETAERFKKRYSLAEPYGSVHIRRCDYFHKTKTCTAPAAIAESIAQYGGGLKTWLFFLYAEDGYREVMDRELRPLGVRALFEDDVVLNDRHPQDNYFTYLLGKYLNGGADTILETHNCHHPPPLVLKGRTHVNGHGIYLQRDRESDVAQAQQAGEMFLELEEQAAAVCDSRDLGAKLAKPEGFRGGTVSQDVLNHER